MTTALIDGDIFIYKAACGVEKSVRWPDGVWTYSADENKGVEIIKVMIAQILESLKTDKYIICFTDTQSNFRKRIYPEYKVNRANFKKPLILDALRDWCLLNQPTELYEDMEADDVMGILATDGSVKDPVIVTIDKDLAQIPVKIYNPDKKQISLPEHREPLRFFMKQVLVGDKVDNFPGCPGIGDKTADKVLGDLQDPTELWEAVVAQYEKKGLTESEALVQARCAYILQAENYKNGTIKLWRSSDG